MVCGDDDRRLRAVMTGLAGLATCPDNADGVARGENTWRDAPALAVVPWGARTEAALALRHQQHNPILR